MSAKRGPYRKCYMVPHGTGFKYCRAIPKDLQPIEQKASLGQISSAGYPWVAETMAHALAHQHGQRILAFRAGCTTPPVHPSEFTAPDQTKERPGLTLIRKLNSGSGFEHPAVKYPGLRRACARRFIELVGNSIPRI